MAPLVKPQDDIIYLLDSGFPDQVRDRLVQDDEGGLDSPIKTGNDEEKKHGPEYQKRKKQLTKSGVFG